MTVSENGDAWKGGNPRAIVRISAKGLFGQFDYELPAKGEPELDLRSLFVLYGDNGAGKTTLLRLTYHLLSWEDGKGHKSAIGQVRFQRFAVELGDGTVIEAKRLANNELGPYRAAILKDSETVDAVTFSAGERSSASEERKLHHQSFLAKLKALEIDVRLVSDERRVSGDEEAPPPYRWRSSHPAIAEFSAELDSIDRHRKIVSPINRAAARLHEWVNRQAEKSNRRGYGSVHTIYTDIAQRIAGAPGLPDEVAEVPSAEGLASRLEALANRSADYARFGLAAGLGVGPMTNSLRLASADAWLVLHKVMQPYVEGIEARLDAIRDLYELLKGFTGSIEQFLGGGKQARYQLRQGFSIQTRKGEPLDLDLLSSGEKQLLLLLFNTLSARDEATILLIDEPEISLNIKWQRLLVPALLDCIRGSDVQLVFATHSIELLAQHLGNVVKLADRSEAEEALDEPRREIEDDTGIGRALHA
ncbi:MAG: ATP-binding protein [Gemmataceae bacterium]|nr:ATP-binding protein [Gemmataceae bacterium]